MKGEELVKDQVCGMVKPKSQMKFTSKFLGKVYYFCTVADKQKFDSHPDYWVSEKERKKFRKAF